MSVYCQQEIPISILTQEPRIFMNLESICFCYLKNSAYFGNEFISDLACAVMDNDSTIDNTLEYPSMIKSHVSETKLSLCIDTLNF